LGTQKEDKQEKEKKKNPNNIENEKKMSNRDLTKNGGEPK
jgi:hypothetical protein